jgi:hypothetical protein
MFLPSAIFVFMSSTIMVNSTIFCVFVFCNKVKTSCWFALSVHHVSQPYFGPSVGVKPNTPKVGNLESSGTPECLEFYSKAQNTSHWGFLVSLKRSWIINIKNGLALVIWTSAAQVMGKRRAGSQTGSLPPDH